MINLLPDDHKKLLHDEYKIRVQIVALIFCSIIVGISIALLVPSYFLSVFKAQAATGKAGVQQTAKETKDRANLEVQLKDQKALIKALAVKNISTNPSHLFELITKNKPSTISIIEMRYAIEETTKFVINVRGIAPTRQSLVDFTTALRKESLVEKLDLPVSNFAKDSNIDFNFSIFGKI